MALRIADLHDALTESDSATLVLDSLFQTPVVVRRLSAAAEPPDTGQRRRLEVGPNTEVRHRCVELLAGTLPVSQADLWFVPERLPPLLVEQLEATDTPFGRVMRRLELKRLLITARFGRPDEDTALEHRALLTLPDGRPVAEVLERYRWTLFGGS